MSVCGSLMWIALSCGPGISYSTSRLQSAIRKVTVEDILLANRTVKYVKEHTDCWHSVHIWDENGKTTPQLECVSPPSQRRLLVVRASRGIPESRCRGLVYKRRAFTGTRSMQHSSSGVSKCCPEEGSELDYESRDTSARGCGRSIGLRAGLAPTCMVHLIVSAGR